MRLHVIYAHNMYAIKCIWSLYFDRIDYMLQWYAFEVTYVGVVLMA